MGALEENQREAIHSHVMAAARRRRTASGGKKKWRFAHGFTLVLGEHNPPRDALAAELYW